MAGAASLLPELEDVIQNGSMEKRAETLTRITNLFLSGADSFKDEHVQLFDGVIGHLITEIETKARAELSRRLAPIGNAPFEVLRRLACDDDIAVAGPVLTESPRITESDLIDIARSKSQAHLFAISSRSGIAEAVTEVLVMRGDSGVVRNVADNRGARFSEKGFSHLVERAQDDDDLAEKVGQRPDIPAHLFRDLVVRATEVVRKRLLAAARPETQAEIRRVLAKVAGEIRSDAGPARDFTDAGKVVAKRCEEHALSEQDLVEYAEIGFYEETVVTLSELCRVPIEVVDRLLEGDRPDPVLILCKAMGFAWQTARSIMMIRPGAKELSTHSIDAAFSNFDKLAPATAQRVLRFWQIGYDERALDAATSGEK